MIYFAILSAGSERRVSEAAGQGPVGLDAPLFIGLLSIYKVFPINDLFRYTFRQWVVGL